MNTGKSKNSGFSDLRKRAEALLSKSSEKVSSMSAEEIKKLVQELGIHQLELELQNEDLKKAHEKIEESRSHFFELFDLAPFGYFKIDNKGIIVESNLAAKDILGLDTAGLLNRKFTDFVVAEYQDEFYRLFSKRHVKSEKKICEIKLKKGKKETWVHLKISHLKSHDGVILSYLLTVNDITELKQVQKIKELSRNMKEKELMLYRQQEINKLNQSLLKPAALDEKLRIITEGIVKIFNVDFCRIWLIRPGDLCEKGCIHARSESGVHVCLYRDRCLHLLSSSGRYTHLDGKVHRRVPFGTYKIGRIASGLERRFLTNHVVNAPHVHNHQWAREIGLVSFAGYQLKLSHGKTIGVMALFSKHPILPTEDALLEGFSNSVSFTVQQAIAEEVVTETNTRLLEAEKVALSGSIAVDLQSPSLSHKWSSGLYHILGEKTGKFEHTPDYYIRFVHPEDREKVYLFQENLMKGIPCEDIEYRIIRKDGTVRWIASKSSIVNNKLEKPSRLIVSILDISNRKESEKLIVLSQKMEALGTLAGGMAHEFNNIIGVMMGYAQILKEDKSLTEEQVEDAVGIYKQGEKAAQIIGNVLKFSRQEEIESELIDPAVLLKDTIKIVKLILPHNIKLFVHIENDLKLIKGNSVQIQQVILNICNNSISAVGERKGTLKITLGYEKCDILKNFSVCRNKAGYLKLCIEDDGCGMNDETTNQAFNPFFSTKEPGKGTGLGLSVVHGIVKEHKGEVTIKSEIDNGTLLCIFLPIAQDGKKQDSEDDTSETSLKGGESILIVDDEKALMNILNISLSKLGYRVTMTERTVEALKLVTESPDSFDLVISDYAMPEMTGIELYHELIEIKENCPFILISGYPKTDMDNFMRKNSNVVFLNKPLKLAALTQKIRSLMINK